MHRNMAILSSLAAVVSALGAMGCSSSSSPPPASCDTTVPVSFASDVVPVFEKSCTLSSVCHGQMNNAGEENLYLGENAGGTDPKSVYPMLVGVMSQEDPSMPMVAASDTANSFLWHKLQGDQNMFATDCAKAAKACTDCNATTPCGGLMPYQSTSLDPAYMCTVQSWIVQGAKNN